MMHLPNFGDRVWVWPSAPNVQDGETAIGRFLAPGGREVVWDSYWHRRFLEGAVHRHDPRPAASPPAEKE